MRWLVSVAGAMVLVFSYTVYRHVAADHVPEHPAALAPSDDPASILAEANRLSWLGNWDAARPLYQRAEFLFREKNDKKNAVFAQVGSLRAAAPASVDVTLAMLLNDPTVQTDPRLRMWCLIAKAQTDFEVDSSLSKQTWTEAFEIANSLGETEWASRIKGELGIIAFVEGDTARAVSLVGKALLSAYRTGDIGAQVEFLSIAATGFNEEHRFAEAIPIFDRAIKTAEKTDAGFPYLAHIGKATALTGLGKPAQAREMLLRVLSTARSNNNTMQEAQALVQLGDSSIALHNPVEAKKYLRSAGQIFIAMKAHRGLDEAMFQLASVYRQEGDLKEAERALNIGLQANSDRYYLPRALTALAQLKAAQGQLNEANSLFGRAEDVTEGILAALHSGLEIGAVAGSMSETYTEHFKLAVRENDVARAFQVLERVRGRAAAGLVDYRHEDKSVSSRAAAMLEAKIATTQRSLLQAEDPKQRSVLLDTLLETERQLAFEDNELVHNHPAFSAKPALLSSVRSVLREDELLLEYVLDEPAAHCIAITKEGAEIISLPAGKQSIEQLTQSFLSELETKGSGGHSPAGLYEMLLGRMRSLPSKARLIISPDGALHRLPFEVLRDGEGKLLVRSKVISYTPSANILRSLRTSRASVEAPRSLLAVGGIEYGGIRPDVRNPDESSALGFITRGLAELVGSQLHDLPESREEILSIAQLAGKNALVLTGHDATESAFKAGPPSSFRVIHLAAHSVPDPQFPYRASLVLLTDRNSHDDGLLQLREIIRFHLNADLVTLSACQTSVGTSQGEAGVASLEQAFLMAGAKAVVSSTWKVEDHSTTTLMKYFYTHLSKGEDRAASLAHAKLDFLDHYGEVSPYYWAAFILMGDGSGTVSLAD